MDIRESVREVGVFETARNLSIVRESTDAQHRVGAFMPLPGSDIESRTVAAAEFLLSLRKKTYLFLNPELSLVDAMTASTGQDLKFLFATSSNLSEDAKVRLQSNLPYGVAVFVLEEPAFPKDFFPCNGVMVVCGYEAMGRAMVLEDTYRMVEHYQGFRGKKIFIPYVSLSSALRYDGWRELRTSRMDLVWDGFCPDKHGKEEL